MKRKFYKSICGGAFESPGFLTLEAAGSAGSRAALGFYDGNPEKRCYNIQMNTKRQFMALSLRVLLAP